MLQTTGFRASAAAALVLLCFAAPTRAMPGPGALDSLARYAEGLGAFGFTGQIVVAEGDSVVLERAFGVTDANNRPVGTATAFAAGSITKSVTAALIVKLADEGRFSLDDPLARLLPGVPADKAATTPRQLLSHTAGLPADAEGVFEQDSRETVLRTTLAAPLARAPGVRFGYSNAGFQLLAAIAERATGIAYPRLVDSLLFAPAGMDDSGTGSAFARASLDAATGRNEWSYTGSLRAWRQPWAGSGAGDLVTTAHDLWRWARALQGAGALPAAQRDTLTRRRAPVNPQLWYGFGMWLVPQAGAPDLVSIGGDIPGYHAGIWIETRAPWRIVAVTSAGERWGRSLPVTAAQRALWRILSGAAVTLPPETVKWPADRLAALAGNWTLSPSGRLTLARDGTGLRLQLAGSDAMTLVQGADSSGARALVEGRAIDLVRATAAKDDSALARALLPLEQRWAPVLRRALATHEKARGPLIDAVMDGTVGLPWLAGGSRTYLRLHSRGGDSDVSFAWLSGGLIDIELGEGRPAPVILPVAPLADGGLGAWDQLDGTLVLLQPFADKQGTGIRLSGGGSVSIARRGGRGR